jgi:hypothetical protein
MCENQNNTVLKNWRTKSKPTPKKQKVSKSKPQPKVFFRRKNEPTMVITHDPDDLV